MAGMNGHGSNGHKSNGRSERKFPHDREIEASILGGVLLNNGLLPELAELEIDDFYIPQHRVVWEAMRNLQAASRPIDIVTVEHEIAKRGKLEAVGGIAFLGDLVLKVPTVDNVLAYRDIVLTLSKNRQAIIEIGSALERAYTWPHDPGELIHEVVGQLARFAEVERARSETTRTRWCTPLEGFLGDEEPDDDDAEDWIVRDLVPRGEPVLWGGPMKGGKTWAAIDLAIAIARGESWLGFENTLGPAKTLGMFLEDSKRRVRKRVWELCRGRHTNYGSGFLSPNDEMLRANLRLTRSSIRIPDPKDVRRFIAEIKAWGARFVVIDNLTRIFVGDPNSTRDAAAFTRAWCEICEETSAAILLLHHTKKVMSNDSKDIDPFETLRGSGDFGAAARNIIVVSPIREDNGPQLAEIRMRGNLDLRREGFILSFERDQTLGKWRTKLVDKGDISSVKHELREQRSKRKEEEKRKINAEKARQRRETAITLARAGGVSQSQLANHLGLTSPRSVAGLLTDLVRDKILRTDRKLGYVLADEPEQPQENLL